MPISQKFGKILDFKTLQNEEGEHDVFHRDQIVNGNPSAGDDIIYDCTPDGYVRFFCFCFIIMVNWFVFGLEFLKIFLFQSKGQSQESGC